MGNSHACPIFCKTYAAIYKQKVANALKDPFANKEFQFWRARTFGTIAIVVLLFMGSTSYSIKTTNSQVLFASRSVILARLNKEVAVKTVVAQNVLEKNNKAVLGATAKTVVEQAQYGDSDTI